MRFRKGAFDKNYKATIGVDFEMERFEVLGVPFSLQLWVCHCTRDTLILNWKSTILLSLSRCVSGGTQQVKSASNASLQHTTEEHKVHLEQPSHFSPLTKEHEHWLTHSLCSFSHHRGVRPKQCELFSTCQVKNILHYDHSILIHHLNVSVLQALVSATVCVWIWETPFSL